MSLPGFSAEAALGRNSTSYTARAMAVAAAGGVVAALCANEGECGNCVNGKQACCFGGHIVFIPCEPPCQTTCAACHGTRVFTDCHGHQTTKAC